MSSTRFRAAVVASVLLGFSAGCEPGGDGATDTTPAAANSAQAIENSKQKGSVEEQAQYLLDQARSFLASDKFQDVKQVAEHVMANFAGHAEEARDLLAQAQARISGALEGATEKSIEGLKGVQEGLEGSTTTEN